MKLKISIGIVSVIMATLVFILLLQIQTKNKDQIVYQDVVVCKSEVLRNTYLDATNIEMYFELKEVDVKSLPEHVMTQIEQLQGQVVIANLDKNSIATSTLLRSENDLYQEYDALQWVSLAIDDFSQAVVGRLRSGDLVDIYAVVEEEEEIVATKIVDGVRVHNTYTSEGELIDVSDYTSLAEVLEIPVQDKDVSDLLTTLDSESIRIVKYEEAENNK